MESFKTAIDTAWHEYRTSEQLFVEFDDQLYSKQIAAMIDHTNLRPYATQSDIRQLCREAEEYHFAAVCINSFWVSFCASILKNKVLVCSVVGFPLGANTVISKTREAQQAVWDGASEIDMVINIGALKDQQYNVVFKDIQEVVEVCEPARVKVILETCYLSDYEKVAACVLARMAGAHFVKTSTGFGEKGAVDTDVSLMRRVVGNDLGVKAAGGIRTFEDAVKMIQSGANRLGASTGIQIVAEADSDC